MHDSVCLKTDLFQEFMIADALPWFFRLRRKAGSKRRRFEKVSRGVVRIQQGKNVLLQERVIQA